ncbi:MAG: hypothetical protein LBJ64_09880 [Deltaproteobacteria bacterium]|nr:hypothetical protein [Deltaproteobacteria bacterium]
MNKREMFSFIKKLSPEDGFQILLDLLVDRPELLKQAYFMAKPVADGDEEKIADDVFQRLDMLTYDEAENKAAGAKYGPYDLGDACEELFQETMEPFMDELIDRVKKGKAKEAKTFCIGIIKGLLKYSDESVSDFQNAVVDCPWDIARDAQSEWLKIKPNAKDVKEVDKLFPKDWP